MSITLQDLQSALDSPRQEFQSSFQGLRTETDNAVGAALTEIRQQSANSAQQVASAVAAQFASASQGFSKEQTRITDILTAEHAAMNGLVTQQQAELEQLTAEVRAGIEKVAAVSDGKLDMVASSLAKQQFPSNCQIVFIRERL